MNGNGGIWTANFWKLTVERMIRAAAAALIPAFAFDGTGAVSLDVGQILLLGGSAAIISLLMALAGSQFGSDYSDPSVLK